MKTNALNCTLNFINRKFDTVNKHKVTIIWPDSKSLRSQTYVTAVYFFEIPLNIILLPPLLSGQVKSYYYWQLVSRSVRLGLEPLIVTDGHILPWKKISVLSFVGRPPVHVQGSQSALCHVYVHTHVWTPLLPFALSLLNKFFTRNSKHISCFFQLSYTSPPTFIYCWKCNGTRISTLFLR